MPKIRNSFAFCVKALCASLLSLLGFDSSSEVRVMYGLPVGDFEIKGSVSSADGNEAVKDAQIKAKYDNEANQIVISIARSDSAGNFVLAGKAVSDRLQIICTPMDSLLRPDTITVNLTYLQNDSLPAESVNDRGEIKKKPLSLPAKRVVNGYRGAAQKTVNFTLNRKH
ncbi:MAG: radical SAM-associated putative lipoprotein [Muribaculaceae bacterium]|nr:radical SAM-associated putative lipoprotein [Muribaculaceae bacterium]MDE6787476.1 radical SAM-associated putative lipoprotein [Muribaculaceae bacterium]